MTTSITETSIIAAALVAQLSIIGIMAMVSALLALGYRSNGGLSYIVLLLALITLVPLMFTRGYSSTWGPLLGATNGEGFSRSTSMPLVFLSNIAAVHLLVWLTGGSRESPFQAIYFLIPTLALFLRESLSHLLLYLALVLASYTFLSVEANVFGFPPDDPIRGARLGNQPTQHRNEAAAHRVAYWFGAVACFVLATYIGYVTRSI